MKFQLVTKICIDKLFANKISYWFKPFTAIDQRRFSVENDFTDKVPAGANSSWSPHVMCSEFLHCCLSVSLPREQWGT